MRRYALATDDQLHRHVQGSAGTTVDPERANALRDAGNVTLGQTFFVGPNSDLTFISTTILDEKGPHPDLDSGFEAFCTCLFPH